MNITEFSEEKKEELRRAIRYYSKLENAETLIEVTINGEVKPCGKIFMDREVEKKFYDLFGREKLYITR